MSQLAREPIGFERFLAMRPPDLRDLCDALADPRTRAESPLDRDVLESLLPVMDRKGFATVSQLGRDAAAAWAARLGIR